VRIVLGAQLEDVDLAARCDRLEGTPFDWRERTDVEE
jgi:hypothetical protein